jgi:predicted dehydrogenase
VLLQPALGPEQGAVVIDRGAGGLEQHPFPKNDMYLDEIRAFVDAIREGRPSPVDGLEGLKSLAIARAVLDSGETGRPVYL